MKTSLYFSALLCGAAALTACDGPVTPDPAPDRPPVTLQEMAAILSSLPLSADNMREVHDAVLSSSQNGYDEEYMMSSLFTSPGSGVGDEPSSTRAASYGTPLRDLIRARLEETAATRSGGGTAMGVDECIEAIASSTMQIYWPFSESWDGARLPVITFDPGSESLTNMGFEIVHEGGDFMAREVVVDEELARMRPVWIVNDNDDSAYVSLEKLRRQDPEWGKGGRVIVKTRTGDDGTSKDGFKTLVLKDFTMKRHYDPWWRGGSEFWVKCGSVQGFTASTEAELRLYQPSVTDFMIAVKRDKLGVTLPFDAVLISEWTDQLDSFAFLIVEDDGGTRTSWKVDATVKIKSKAYGVTIEIPYNERDDIVWRGSLTSRYFEKYAGQTAHFGDVDITFEVI